MNIDYVLANRTDGANPFAIFDRLAGFDQASLYSRIRQMPYAQFVKTAYWFAVSMKVKTAAKMRCQVCNSSIQLQAHHRCYDHHGAEHSHLEDLTALCIDCHNLFHGHSDRVPVLEVAVAVKRNGVRHDLPRHPPANEVIQIPDGDSFTMTRELLNQCRTNGVFTTQTIEAFGIERPLVAGWAQRLIGTVFTRERYQQAMAGRFVYAKKTLKRWAKAEQPF